MIYIISTEEHDVLSTFASRENEYSSRLNFSALEAWAMQYKDTSTVIVYHQLMHIR